MYIDTEHWTDGELGSGDAPHRQGLIAYEEPPRNHEAAGDGGVKMVGALQLVPKLIVFKSMVTLQFVFISCSFLLISRVLVEFGASSMGLCWFASFDRVVLSPGFG